MGSVEYHNYRLTIYSHVITYGNAATPEVMARVRDEIECMWNEPQAHVTCMGEITAVVFRITALLRGDVQPIELYQHLDQNNHAFRIEDFLYVNLSYLHGLG